MNKFLASYVTINFQFTVIFKEKKGKLNLKEIKLILNLKQKLSNFDLFLFSVREVTTIGLISKLYKNRF